jgi:hypothetical protein
MLISVEGTSAYQLEVDQENTWDDAVECVTLFFAKTVSKINRPVCWSITMNDKPAVGSPFFGVFLSERKCTFIYSQ